MVVGDDAQSIYGFRGADVSMMRTFPDRHPNCTIHRIEDNFRSSQNILNAANASLGHMTSAFRKTLRSPRQGDAPAIFIHENPDVMRKRVVDDIKTQRKEGALMGTAVLGRSNRSLIQIEMLLKRERIPYRRFGGLSFDECAHVKDVMSLFKICDNPSDQRSWIRIMQWQEGIGRTTASELGKVLSSGAPLPSKLMKHGSVIAVVKGVMDRMRRGMPSEAFHEAMQYYMPFIPMLYDNERDRSEDLMEMANVVKDFTSLREFLDTFIVDRPDRKTGDPSCTVTLSTIHSAKGLEWDRVHVVDVVTGIFPSSYCATREDYDQERRLFYVAITRPKTHLFIHAFGSQRDASGFMMQTGMSSLCHEIQSVCQVIT
jgi:DNA helicase-2/ATP-dependent DNA helicase PcrA